MQNKVKVRALIFKNKAKLGRESNLLFLKENFSYIGREGRENGYHVLFVVTACIRSYLNFKVRIFQMLTEYFLLYDTLSTLPN